MLQCFNNRCRAIQQVTSKIDFLNHFKMILFKLQKGKGDFLGFL